MNDWMTDRSQRGAALIISLVLLVLLALISVAGIKAATSQERMAANNRLRNDSFQAAEAGLRLAERALKDAPSIAGANCVGASCNAPAAVFDIDHVTVPGSDWVSIPAAASTNGMTVWYRITSLGNALAPAHSTSQAPGQLYRIIVVSFRGATRTVLESVYVLSIV